MARFGSGISIQSVILSFIFITIVEANCNTNITFWPTMYRYWNYTLSTILRKVWQCTTQFLYFLFFNLSRVHISTNFIAAQIRSTTGYLFCISINDWTNLMMFYEFVIWISAIYQSLMDTHNSNKYSKLYPHSKILSRLNLILILGILMETTGFLSSLLSFIFKSLYI